MITTAEEIDPSTIEDVVAMYGPFAMTRTGVVVIKPATFEELAAAMEWAQQVKEAIQFWIGDLIEYGEHKFGEKYSQLLDATPYAEKSLRNAAYVSRNVARPQRNPNVPFAHHAEVAPLSPEQQTAWLTKCEEEGLTREQLRVQIKAAAAQVTGKTVEYWLRVSCTSAADQEQLASTLRTQDREVFVENKDKVVKPAKAEAQPVAVEGARKIVLPTDDDDLAVIHEVELDEVDALQYADEIDPA